MTPTTVAVITRTKDRPLFLQRAMRSVLAQTHGDWIHVIVNDGGDPAPVDLLVRSFEAEYAGRVRVVHHAESRGMQNASNAGLDAADSEFVVIHDDDDSWEPDFLEVAVAFLEEEGPDSAVRGVVTQTTQILEEITVTGEFREERRLPYHPFAYVNMAEMRQRNLFPPIAFLYRRSAHEAVGRFRQEFDVLGDHDFNLRFLRRFEIGVVPTFHALYHWRHGSQGNTVTSGREIHRRKLCRMKNVYYRESLDDPESAVGSIDEITIPPPATRDMGPFRIRREDTAPPAAMPDFRREFRFSALSLDVFDTVLKRRCHHPKDVFQFMEHRASGEAGLPEAPYALARVRAEEGLRERLGREVTLDEIYGELERLLGLGADGAKRLMELELRVERDLFYADPRWTALYAQYREAGVPVVFVSDMYLDSATISGLLEVNGFAEPRVFVSSELRLTKHDGELLPEVARQLDVAPEEILHVGDNFHSDCMKALQGGFQAYHWGPRHAFLPWYAEVTPDYYEPADTLSPRIMGQVRVRGEERSWEDSELLERLGYEAAGPLYLAYMLWVVREAKKDGFRRLVLLGRDGYYWEKALEILSESKDPGIEFAYLHASRKVINFASFDRLDDEALEFLMTPNPALRVRDFIDRTGLEADKYLDAMRMAGFADPEEVLTNEMGGQYTDSGHPAKLRRLFLLVEADLRKLFARDRAGFRQLLDEVSFDPAESAFVDIGWRASSVKPMHRIVDPGAAGCITGYYFGTWREAEPGKKPVRIKSFFMHLGEPAQHEALIRESVNWIESLHSAPYPTLLSLSPGDSDVTPEFSSRQRGGFSPEQQERIWAGAEAFLRGFSATSLPDPGERGGFAYIFLVLKRLVCEPSPAELAAWGSLEHSDGYGIEVYKPLVQPVPENAGGEELMAAYRASSWRRGFLASLSDERRDFVLERLEATKPKTFEELRADLEWKIKQNDQLWAENARLKYETEVHARQSAELREVVARLNRANDKLDGDLKWKSRQTEEFWAENNRLQNEAKQLTAGIEAARAETTTKAAELEAARGETAAKAAELEAARGETAAKAAELEAARGETAAMAAELESARAEIARLECAFRKRGQTLKAFFLAKPPEPE